MRTTLALHWKTLVNKIHPPLPLTARDSQRLLNLLNSSFRQRLDRTHPTDEEHHVDTHVQSILTSPLFLATSARSATIFQHVSQQTIHPPSWQEKMNVEPMTVLQDCIARGAADLETARLCLDAQMRKCSTSSDVSFVMKSSNAGSIVQHWLWSSGRETSLDFLQDARLTRLLIQFLVAEGRHNRVSSWIRHLDRISRPSTSDYYMRMQGQILFQLTKAEVLYGAGPISAIKTFTQKLDDFVNAEQTPSGIRSRFILSGNYIAMCLPQMLKSGGVSSNDYDTVFKYTSQWCRPNTFIPAWLSVQHPERPDPYHTLAYLHHLAPRELAVLSQRRRNDIVGISLKAAELLLAHNQGIEVAWIMNELRTHFAPEIGFKNSVNESLSTIQEKKHIGEGSNIRLLQNLALECGGSLAISLVAGGHHASGLAKG